MQLTFKSFIKETGIKVNTHLLINSLKIQIFPIREILVNRDDESDSINNSLSIMKFFIP